ncbi:MAG: TetR/AcrR family transcriptional regulator [Acidobacteria bacterium]|nr:TetR/AcrR family transcriptional regulator [Acidobacteriota bacterium]
MVAEKVPGRPRDPETARRILDVTLRHLAEEGYARMSLDTIAIAACVSKPTIYRRWPGKADLATAALRTVQLAEPEVNTGSTTGDLAATLENFSRNLLRPNGMTLIGTVLAEEIHTPELLALFRVRIVAPRRAMLRAILHRARRNGELRRGANVEAAINMMIGAFYARYLSGEPIPPAFPRELVKIVWPGISRARA